MKYIVSVLIVLAVLITLSGCTTREPASEAEQTLEEFLDRMNEGVYEKAAELYGGAYQSLVDNNPNIDPKDLAALLKNACEINGFQCLKVRSISLEDTNAAGESIFRVEFNNEDGTQFVREACCGEGTTDDPAKSSFIFKVIRGEDGGYRVMDLPPYVP